MTLKRITIDDDNLEYLQQIAKSNRWGAQHGPKRAANLAIRFARYVVENHGVDLGALGCVSLSIAPLGNPSPPPSTLEMPLPDVSPPPPAPSVPTAPPTPQRKVSKKFQAEFWQK